MVILEPAYNIPIFDETDVLVVGGGPAGISAAVSAARNGAKVALLERYGHLGGMATGGLVILIPHLSHGTEIQELAGLNQEWIERLDKYGGAIHPTREEIGAYDTQSLNKWKRYFSFVWNHRVRQSAFVEPELLKIVLNEMVEESNVNVHLHSWGSKALMEGDSVKGVIFESKEGRKAILSKIVIDATGDGDIFSSAGVDFEVEADKSLRNSMMAVVYRIGNIDFQKFAEFKEQNPEQWGKHVENIHKIAGFKTVPFPTTRNDVVWVNNWLPGRDCLKVKDLTDVEFSVRKSIIPVLEYLRKEVSGFQNGFLYDTASQIGTRGSRRVKGEYKLTIDDLKQGKKHDDIIAVFPSIAMNIVDSVIGIPYRALVPQKIDNLLVAGRCFSSDIEANDLTNLIPHCVAMGEAAGAAAAIAIDSNVKVRDVNMTTLQTMLKKQGVYLPVTSLN